MSTESTEPPDRRRIDRRAGNEDLRLHFDRRFDSLEKTIESAFPDGDLDGHRRSHETVIAAANDRASMWKAVREKTVSGGVYAALGLLIMAIWEYFKAEVKK